MFLLTYGVKNVAEQSLGTKVEYGRKNMKSELDLAWWVMEPRRAYSCCGLTVHSIMDSYALYIVCTVQYVHMYAHTSFLLRKKHIYTA